MYKIDVSNKSNVWVSFSFWLLASSIFALSLLIPSGDTYGPALLLFCFAFYPFLSKGLKLRLEDKKIILSFIIYALSMFVLAFLHSNDLSDLDNPSRFLLAIPILLLLLKKPLHKTILFYSVALGAVSAFSMSFYDKIILDLPRAHGYENPIMFGNISLLLSILSFVSAFYFLSEKKSKIAILFCICGVLALLSLFFSATRGGLVALPLIIFFLIWNSRKLLGNKILITISILLPLFFGAVLLSPQFAVKKRINEAIVNVDTYVKGGNKDTPVGHRFELWKASIEMFISEPFVGIGENQQDDFKKELVSKKAFHERIVRFNHAHNEFLNELGLHGLFGFIALMIVYLVPLKLFINKMNASKNWSVKTFAMSGAVIPMLFMDFSLTQAMFTHSIGVMMYAFSIVIFWAATRWAEREERELGNIA